ncbi:metallophosphoesterase family protein [Paenibacillus thalictri]|uniref:Calcineurin-like phosphoesterase domain-containing protein n=1 Tax=Paenibacillus thalictri TaxID=2527873 RepID=A0A4Q9DWZ7_9BACL|nr:metallophosphoesterase [Paenibacillus thalictri]TBL80550.1 hypothetical protein EYB31_04800 [Paenibacillus thalictri]
MTGTTIRFGLMADVHQDFMYQAESRLREFIDRMNRERPDFIIQLGDFCYPREENRPFVGVWESFTGPKYHVLGNHDMDVCDKRTIMDFLGMERNYYSFDCGDYHFIVLDANFLSLEDGYADYEYGNYHKLPDAINNLTSGQLAWLKTDLAATERQTVIFSHQNLESHYVAPNMGIRNHEEFRAILREANETSGFQKVIACLNGHQHLDGVKVIDDVYYVQINSMSYYYLGKNYTTTRYSEEISAAHRLLPQCAPYEESLYAIVTLEPGLLTIEGKQSRFVGPTPLELGHSNSCGGHVLVPHINSRRLLFPAK